MFLQLAFCTSFQRGEGRNGRVRTGWSQIRFRLLFAVFLNCTVNCSRLVSAVQHIANIWMCYPLMLTGGVDVHLIGSL